MWPKSRSERTAGDSRSGRVMKSSGQVNLPYRARAARRPFLFWWQAFFLLGVIVFLWSLLPVSAVLYEPRVFSPFPEPHVSYVTLEATYAALIYKKLQTAWSMGFENRDSSFGMDLGLFDFDDALPPPSFLEQGALYPGVWHPSAVKPLPVPLPLFNVPSSANEDVLSVQVPLQPPEGFRCEQAQALADAGFRFSFPDEGLPDRSGHCRFEVETDADGTVLHVLLLSAPCESSPFLERVLLKGRAKGAARGALNLSWRYAK